MEENVGLFAADGDVGCCVLGNRIRRSSDVLLLFVLGELLIMTSSMFLNFHQQCILLHSYVTDMYSQLVD